MHASRYNKTHNLISILEHPDDEKINKHTTNLPNTQKISKT